MHCNRMSWWRNTVCWRRIVEARNLLKPFLLYSCVPCSLSSPHLVCLWKKHSGTDCLYSGKSWSTALLCWGSKGWHLQPGGKRTPELVLSISGSHFWQECWVLTALQILLKNVVFSCWWWIWNEQICVVADCISITCQIQIGGPKIKLKSGCTFWWVGR